MAEEAEISYSAALHHLRRLEEERIGEREGGIPHSNSFSTIRRIKSAIIGITHISD